MQPEHDSAPATLDPFAALDRLDPFDHEPRIPGRSAHSNVAPVHAPARELSPEDRDRIAAAALPRLAGGAGLRAVAVSVGVAPSTLRAWCLAFDGDAYRAALVAQVGAHLAGAAEELDEAARMARVASSLTLKGKRHVTSDGDKSTGYTLAGPALAGVARARASIALDAAKFWQWIGERRAPAVFGERDKAPPAPRAASFTFIVDGRRSTVRGRVFDQPGEGSTLPALPHPEPVT